MELTNYCVNNKLIAKYKDQSIEIQLLMETVQECNVTYGAKI